MDARLGQAPGRRFPRPRRRRVLWPLREDRHLPQLQGLRRVCARPPGARGERGGAGARGALLGLRAGRGAVCARGDGGAPRHRRHPPLPDGAQHGRPCRGARGAPPLVRRPDDPGDRRPVGQAHGARRRVDCGAEHEEQLFAQEPDELPQRDGHGAPVARHGQRRGLQGGPPGVPRGAAGALHERGAVGDGRAEPQGAVV
mmetsp:Transcript_15856/g.39933  ORF Transcript_15856/g.39933 Transcript_15856/m.39933 type:complete len:200 (+) Transcript_15856:164-763(+)